MKKTNKAFIKRFRVTRRGKVLHKSPHQDHFRAKKSGDAVRKTHKQKSMARPTAKQILREMPFN
jgi:ribosomal protein L35